MDPKMRKPMVASSKSTSSLVNEHLNSKADQQFMAFDSANLGYDARSQQPFPEFPSQPGNQAQDFYWPEREVKGKDQAESAPGVNNPVLTWDPRVMLSNLSFLEQKIHQVQDIVRSIINQEGQFANRANELAAQQQLVTADLTCIIIQLISTAGTLLPNIKNTILSANTVAGQPSSVMTSPGNFPLAANQQQDEILPTDLTKISEYDDLLRGLCSSDGEDIAKCLTVSCVEGSEVPNEDHDVKDYDDGNDGENLPPGSYEILQLEKEEILAPHTHFCTICGKGFKRDANLRMHMRGHGDEYKTPAALAKPCKEGNSEPAPIKRYSCPFVGCKRNKEHKKFQPLKTILCVKNHYKRSHCDKSYICSRCNSKKFSVIADLKTHEKHCGRDKWLCSCGTTFSRKDKLFGHVALFQGHTPALPIDDVKVSGSSVEVMNGTAGTMSFSFGGSSSTDVQEIDIKGLDDSRNYLSPINFDSCNFGGLDDFSRSGYEISDNSFFMLPPGSCNFNQRNGDN